MKRRQASDSGIQCLLCMFKWQSHHLLVICSWASFSLPFKVEILTTILKDLSFIVFSVLFSLPPPLVSSISLISAHTSYFSFFFFFYFLPLLFLSLSKIFSEFFSKTSIVLYVSLNFNFSAPLLGAIQEFWAQGDSSIALSWLWLWPCHRLVEQSYWWSLALEFTVPKYV